MEEKDFNELSEETRARGVKRTSDIKIPEVSTSKKKRAKKKASAETTEPAQVQNNFDDPVWSAGAVGESEVLDYRSGNRQTEVNITARVKRLVRVAMAICIQQVEARCLGS